MKKLLIFCSIFLYSAFMSNAQLITFDDQGHADFAFLPNPYTIVNSTESFRFTFSNGGAALSGSHRYRTTDTDGCNVPGAPFGYLRVDPSATTWTMETVSGNELNLGDIRFLNMYNCYSSFVYSLTITGFKNGTSTGSQAFSVTNGNSIFTPNASFDDVDRIVITSTDVAGLGMDDINWGPPIVACTDPTVPTVTFSPTTVCQGSGATLNISGTLNDATAWHIYTGSCGGTVIGTTTTGTFAIPGTISSSTTYFVRGEGGCVTPGSCGSVTITPTALDNASFSYSASAYCVNATDPTPTVTGLAGGSFSSTAGLSLNASTGAIDVSASTPGTYTVTYTTAGTCPNSSNVGVTINALDNASFNYSAASYCVNATDPTPTVTGLAGGTFSSTAGLSINASTGAIDVSASTPGAYNVTYTTSGACPNSSSAGVTINALDNASFSYSAPSYCVNATDPTPTVTGLAGGSFSSTAGLSINGSTGAIDVSASTPGTYTVTYTTAGTCPNSSNVGVTINALDNASFNYSAASYCVNATDPTPTITGLAGGTFSSTAGLSINASTGAIDVSASTPGTYTVTYTTSGACPNSSGVGVTINALDNASFSYSAASYCVNATDPTPTVTGLAGGTFSSTAGLSINASTGVIDISASTSGNYLVTYTTTGTCPNSATFSVTIEDVVAPVADNGTLSTLTDECSITSLTAPTATDNCAGTITGTHNATLPITASTNITWTYNDGNGNTSTQNQTVTINDVTAPVADNGTLSTLTDECSITSLTAPTATDNCAGTITGTHNATLPITASTTIVWTYDDGNGNTSTQNQTITINDVTAPVADNGTLSTLTDECSITSLTAPTATDNCAGTITGTHNAILPITASTTIVWTYDDGNGNTSTQNQTVTINDVTAPVADNGTLSTLTDECSITSLNAPTATDNCAGTITGTHNATLPITASTTITWTYNDGNGNTSSQTQNVVIDDVTAPVPDVASLADITSFCAPITNLPSPTAIDNCTGTITGTHNAIFPIVQGTTLVTWTYDDGNGNTSAQTQNIIITPIDNGITQVNDTTLSANAIGHNYQWIDCNNANAIIPNEIAQVFVPSVAGSYACIINNGTCSDTTECLSSTVSIIENSWDSELIEVYPNPTEGRITINSVETIESITVLNSLGQVVETIQNIELNEAQLDLPNEPGVYLIQVNTQKAAKIIRIVKK
jgi:hypothetical protein